MMDKEEFINIWKSFGKETRRNLVYNPYEGGTNPMSLNILYLEIVNDTHLGMDLLERLGK